MSTANIQSFDVVVIGSGPGGSVLGAQLAQAGLRALMIEKHPFPRYHIGESLTGVAGDFIRDMQIEGEMERLQFPVKQGVKVMGRSAKSEFFVPVLRPTWQVSRAEFDEVLLRRAIEGGAEHRDGTVKEILREGEKVVGVRYAPRGSNELVEVRSRFVVDASGHSVILSKHGVAGPRQIGDFDKQVAVFTQVKGALRDPGAMGNNTVIFYSDVYEWSWFIPLSPEVVSVGLVVPSHLFKMNGDSPEALLRWGFENLNPDLTRRLRDAEWVEPCRVIANYSYRIDPFAGDGWLCIGDAHRFADPIFSFGVASAMVEATAACKAILKAMETGDWRAPFEEYVAYSNRGQDSISDLIKYFWRFPSFFGVQSRGAFRKDIIRLLAGDCFDVGEIPALTAMRKSLALVSLPETEEGGPPRSYRSGRTRWAQQRPAGAEAEETGAPDAQPEPTSS
jgi:FADH2-dependent halogenase